jgi:hypothetical protein
MRRLNSIALIVFLVGFPVLLWELAPLTHPRPLIESPTTADVLTVMFGAATVVLAVLAVLIGTIAIWGYHTIRDEAIKASRDRARAEVKKFISSEEIKRQIIAESRPILETEVERYMAGIEFSQSQPAQDGGQSSHGAENAVAEESIHGPAGPPRNPQQIDCSPGSASDDSGKYSEAHGPAPSGPAGAEPVYPEDRIEGRE